MIELETLSGRDTVDAAPLPLHALTYPEHGPTGWILIALCCATGAVSMLFAPVAAIVSGEFALLAVAPFGIGYGALAFWMAYEFYRFACWTWFLLIGAVVRSLFEVFPWQVQGYSPQAGKLVLIGILFVYGPVSYLWKRRYDFWFESDAVRRQLDFERNRDRWARRSWKDDARMLKRRMAEREVLGRSSPATRDPSFPAAREPLETGAPGEPLREAGRAG